jgi:hypothetical protein
MIMKTALFALTLLSLTASAQSELPLLKKQTDEPLTSNSTVCLVGNRGTVKIDDKDGSLAIFEKNVPIDMARIQSLAGALPAKPTKLVELTPAQMKNVKRRWVLYKTGNLNEPTFLLGETKGFAMVPTSDTVVALGQEIEKACAAAYKQARAAKRHRPF